jgi:predicted dehydrogenase
MPNPKHILLGMVGGGQGAFIGAVHRTAAALDGEARFVAGCLSSTPERALASGRAIGLADSRNYPTWQAMLDGERALPRGERIDAVCIVTPNNLHFPVAKAFAEAGFHIVCDKPLTRTLAEAQDLAATVRRAGTVFAVTYNYTGYPLVRAMAEMVRDGRLGAVRKAFVEYHQGWLATDVASSGQKQAAWRADPALAGAGALGDIGSHAENLLRTVTGLSIDSLCADVHTFVPGRRVDDDAAVLLRMRGGARAVLTCSQVCVGDENGLSIRVHGERGSLSWKQEHPNAFTFTALDAPPVTITRGSAGAGPAAAAATRLPPGHPEGFYEAFANIYRGAFGAIRGGTGTYPTLDDGVRGMAFIDACLRSNGAWVSLA